ncbi:MAG: sugar transferase [Bacteroidia bacterium]|nr:sugar transferase [Bacteroidia bacterium]
MSFRFRDLVIAFVALIVLSPLMASIIWVLAITQKKVFFRQQRPGLRETPFTLIKFSTLRDVFPGEEEFGDLRLRLTPVGRYLRKFSLDELPQLFNVLRGDMSLVGPRPLLMEYLKLYTEAEKLRHAVRPGITGWAQINGRNRLSFKEKFQLDIWYVQNRSHFLDLKILALTVLRIFNGKDVYRETPASSGKFDGSN